MMPSHGRSSISSPIGFKRFRRMRKSVLTLGTFDGVHLGHQALISKVVKRAKAIGATPVALAFDMPPRHADKPHAIPVLLNTLSEKLLLLKRLGIERVQVLTFD